MAQKKTVKLFLAEGQATGLIVATIPNWAGSIIKGRSADLPQLLERNEAKQAGVYILQGTDPDDPFRNRTYIGQATPLAQRIATHAKEKDWWDVAVLITTQDSNFSAGHFLALEADLIRLAGEANRSQLENVQRPGAHAGGLGEADRADVENFLSEVKLVLPILGLDLLRPSVVRPNKANDAPKTPSDKPSEQDETVFFLKNRQKELGRAMEIDGEFVVLEGSKALRDPGHAMNQYQLHRQKLIENGALVADGEFYIFKRDVPFSSPSKASAVILDRNDNGRTSWKTMYGQTYHDWQQSRVQVSEQELPGNAPNASS